ncbi:hypothetical protein GCM10023149_51970 [Mucilaginibacter gynuensis]|uniref:histidine kinase n=1 Tax=Mucilaginibacter gynuensis TaxID=1302236 RepID=A0ABP8HKS4_9SPHI
MDNERDFDLLNNDSIFRTLIEESPTAVGLYVGREMRIQLANDAMLHIWGKGNIIGQTLREALPELEGQPFHQLLDDVYTTGIPYQSDEDAVDFLIDGKLQRFYFSFTYKGLKNKDGRVWAILNTATDVTELALTRRKLAESEQSTRVALRAGELGTWDLDPINNIVTWDEKCKELYGFPKGDHISYEGVLKHMHPADVERVNKAVLTALDIASGGDYRVEFRTIGAADGKIRWLRCEGKAYFNSDGIAYRFAGTARDISTEVNEQKQQRRLTALVENTDDIICTADLDGNINYINKAGLQLLGIADDENYAPLHASKIYFPEDVPVLEQEIIPALMSKGKWSGRMRYRNLVTGEAIPVFINSFRIDGPISGTPIALASVNRDLRPELAANNERNKLLALIDSSSGFVSLSELDGTVTYVNATGRAMLGIDANTTNLGHNSQFIMPYEIKRLKDEINKQLLEEGRWTGRVDYRHFKTGEAIPVEGSSMLVYDSLTGKAQGRASIARDLRQEIADKKALQDSQHLLHNITTASPTALWMSDREGRIIYTNQTWLDWTGQTNDEVMGDGWLQPLVAEDRAIAAKKFIGDLAARRHYEVSFRLIRKDGEIRWCVATGNPQYHSDGTFAGYIGSCTDVTEYTLIEQQLQERNIELNVQVGQFEFVNNFMPVQLWTATVNGDLDYVNQRAIDYFGNNEGELADIWQNFVHPDDMLPTTKAWLHSIQSGSPFQVEFRLKGSDGIYRWHLARALPFTRDGKIVKWFGTNTDIDEQKQMQRQKDDFLGIASHELKTPVTSIKAYAQVLGAMLEKEGEQRKAEMVSRMDAQVNRLTNLIGDLLDVTKINSGRLQFNKVWFDINKVVRETMVDLQHTTHRHKLVEDFTETGKIYTDKDRIGQVITNLITNAIKYSPQADRIIVSTRREKQEIVVCVQDFGIGIADNKQDKVFEQFYRVSGSKQHTFPGLGLGLYISSEIIKREGGRMWVNSIEGKGSTFCFSLPVTTLN